MALTVLFVIHLLAIGLKCIESANVDEKTLNEPIKGILFDFAEDDYIEVLHFDDFNINIYNSTVAWAVMFYNSHEDQWMDTYFTWKYLADSISRE